MSKIETRESVKIFGKFGAWVREICDACGRPLGAVRYTLRGDLRAWCSAKCRAPELPAGWRSRPPKDPAGESQKTLDFAK